MKALRGLLKLLAYAVFFLAALVFFVYLTLPIEETKDFLVRKAADEFNADLVFNDEDSLDTCGLTCVEAQNVSVTFRASPEEMAEYREKLKIYKEWREAKNLAEAEGKSGAAGPASAASDAADKDDDDDDGDDKAGSKTSSKVAALGADKGKDDDAPVRPERPSKTVELDRLKVAVSPFDLIGGAINGNLEAELIGGTIDVALEQSEEAIAVNGNIADLDVSQLAVLKQIVPLPIVGTIGAELDLTLPLTPDKNGKPAPDLEALSGTASLAIDRAAIGPGRIESKKLGAFPFFDVPKARIETFGGQMVFARQRMTFENFKITGKDVEGELTGYVQLKKKLKDWHPNAHINFKFSDEFLKKHRDVKTALTSMAYLRRGQQDGYTGFQMHGTFDNLKFRPRKKRSARTSRTRKPKSSLRDRAASRSKKSLDRKGRSTARTGSKRPNTRTASKTRTSGRAAKDAAKVARVPPPTIRKGRIKPLDTADDTEGDEPEEEEFEDDGEPEEGDEPEETDEPAEDTADGEGDGEEGTDSEAEGKEEGGDTKDEGDTEEGE